ncbi:MAG: ComEC/Rec2 family competence protein [Clostridia bacterium]|nr:ComEC/Rec2 family competence protein [Clostridia bacterium]
MDFVKRPVAVVTMSFFALFCLISNLSDSSSALPVIISGILLLIIIAGSLAVKGKLKVAARYGILIAAGALAASVFAVSVFFPSLERYSYLEGGTHSLSGEVKEVIYETSWNSCVLFDVSSADGEEVSFTAALTSGSHVSPGDEISAVCEISAIKNTSSFDAERYYLSKGATLAASADTVVITGESPSLAAKASRLNSKLCSILEEKLSPEAYGVSAAVLLGNRTGLSDSVKSDFSRIGISHLIAISGMHVSFICVALISLLKKFGIGKRVAYVFVILAMIFYMFLTGFTPSVVRAAIVACIASLITVLGISYDSFTALSVCGAAMVIADPFVSQSAAMQLSFCAYAGCLAGVYLTKRIKYFDTKREDGIPKRLFVRLIKAIVFTLVVVLTSVPVMTLYFDELSLLSPVSNLIFIPAFSVILYLSALILIFSPISPVCAGISFVAEKLISAVLHLAHAGASIGGATVSLRYPHVPYIAAAVCVLMITAILTRKKISRIAVCGIALCIAVSGAGCAIYNASRPDITVIRAGTSKNEALAVVSDGEAILIDISGGGRTAADACIAKLSELCITDIEKLAIVKCTSRSQSTAEYLVDTERICEVFVGEKYSEEKYLDELSSSLGARNTEYSELPALPEKLTFNSAEISFSAVVPDGKSTPVVCIKIEGKGGSIIYLGSNYYKVHPNVTALFGKAGSVIFGSAGNKIGAPYEYSDYFDGCKIYSFAGAAVLSGFEEVSYCDVNSTVVLNID